MLLQGLALYSIGVIKGNECLQFRQGDRGLCLFVSFVLSCPLCTYLDWPFSMVNPAITGVAICLAMTVLTVSHPYQHTCPGLGWLVRCIHDHSLQPAQLFH